MRNFWATVFLLFFAVIYESFSHNVISYYMLGAFLIPVVGSLPYILMEAMKKGSAIGSVSRELWQLGIFTLALGSVMKGALEIYATTNKWTLAYLPIAFAFVFAAVFTAYGNVKGKQSG